MTTRVVTLMWGDAYERYGRQFLETFNRYWPHSVELVVVTDRLLPEPRARQIMLPCVHGYGHFMARWKDDKRAQGYGSHDRKADPAQPFWKNNALKWMPQALAPRAALDGMNDGDVLAWFDADVHTIREVSENWLQGLLAKCDLACLQRVETHSEIGGWVVRVNARTRRFMDIFAGIYTSGAFAKLPETHSAYVFDRALKSCGDVTVRNLNQSGRRGHVWPRSPLGEFTEHKKGKRKN